MCQLELFPPSENVQQFRDALAAYRIARVLHREGVFDLGQLWARRGNYLMALHALRVERCTR